MKKIVLSASLLATLTFAGDYTNSIGMKFKDIPSGSFVMGTPTPNCPKDNPFTKNNENKECSDSRWSNSNVNKSETPAHRVSLSSFYLGETEVTQGQWYEIMGNNPAEFQNGNPNMPVENVSWYDAQSFVDALNKKEKTTKYRLPSEEEWEYAARAGTTTKWSFGDSESYLGNYAWYTKTTNNKGTMPVGTKKPNAFGLYDMHGNVWEWTDSCWTSDYNSGKDCSRKVFRGGGWSYDADSARSAFRFSGTPDYRYCVQGFRLLRTK